MIVPSLRQAPPSKLLRLYLVDHLAGAAGGVRLAGRAAGNNRGTPYGTALEQLRSEIESEKDQLERLIRHLGSTPSRPKQLAAAVGERVARGKLNGQLLGYSPLSRLWEIEALSAAVENKTNLWRSLEAMGETLDAPPDLDVSALRRQGEDQRDRLETLRQHAAKDAFLDGSG